MCGHSVFLLCFKVFIALVHNKSTTKATSSLNNLIKKNCNLRHYTLTIIMDSVFLVYKSPAAPQRKLFVRFRFFFFYFFFLNNHQKLLPISIVTAIFQNGEEKKKTKQY